MVGRRVPLFGRVGMAARLRVIRRTAGGFLPVHLQIYGKNSRIFRSVAEKSVFFGIRFVPTPVERGFEGSWAGESDNEEYDIEKEIWG